ncbi:MAG: hypothetical protein IJV04_01295, partial [Lachnospiraceae bacterium]|nr:hypothetical protein [Lachnospiraceae bacterium]
MDANKFLPVAGYRLAAYRKYDGASIYLRNDVSVAKVADRKLRTIVLGEKNHHDDYENAVFLESDQLKIGLRMRPDRFVVHVKVETEAVEVCPH